MKVIIFEFTNSREEEVTIPYHAIEQIKWYGFTDEDCPTLACVYTKKSKN